MGLVFTEIESIEEIDEALARNEAVIRRGLIDIGEAFKEIVKGKMYKAKGYKTFDTYCLGEWQLTSRHVQRIMRSSLILQELVEEMRPMGRILQLPERVIREVVELPTKESRIELITKVLETNPNPTAKEMKAAVEEKLVEILPEMDRRVQKIKQKKDRSIAIAEKNFTKWWKEFTATYSNIPLWELDKMAIQVIKNH